MSTKPSPFPEPDLPSNCLAQLPAIVWTTNHHFRLTRLSGALATQLSKTPAATLSQSLQQLLDSHPPHNDLLRAHRQARRGQYASFSCWLGPDCFQGSVAPLRQTTGIISGCLGIALNATEQRASQQQFADAHERQRSRLSYELSEKLAQHLVGLSLQLQSLEKKLAHTGTDRPLAATAKALETAVHTACDLARRLYPAELDRLGFVSAVQSLLSTQQLVYGTHCQLLADPDFESIQPSWGIQLYRLLESALLYLLSSGQPRHLKIQLRANAKTWKLQVASLGTKPTTCATSAAESERCLLGQRIDLLGGTWRIQARPNGGAKIICALPRHDLH